MIREKRKRRKKRKLFGLAFLTFLLLLAIAALIVVNVFTVEKVEVTGNEHYDDDVIAEWILNDEYSWNTLYVYLKYRFKEPESIPFVDTMEISMEIPHTIQIHVYEKGILGYVYLDSLGQNAYIDKDGFVVEISSEVIEGVPKITGLSLESVVLYEKLPIKSKTVLKNLMTITQTLKKYGLVPDTICYERDNTYTLEYQSVRVLLGAAENINEKILRLTYILPELEGLSGTLHLENWTENTTDISFEKSE